jgi:hypothetical protein
LDKQACDCLTQFGTIQVLIENYYLKNYNSIYVKDQVGQFKSLKIQNYSFLNIKSFFIKKKKMATILANMALYDTSRIDIFEFNGLTLLVEFLNEKPVEFFSDGLNNSVVNSAAVDSEISACERVQQKSAIAISRFSKESKYALTLMDHNVIQRLSELCRDLNARNNSDSVLVACIVRKFCFF